MNDADELDPEELATLRTIFELREVATQHLLSGAPAQGLADAEKALEHCNRLKVPEFVPPLLKEKFAPLFYSLGRALAQEHRLDDASRALQQVAKIEHQIGNLSAEASVLSDIASIKLEAGRVEEAIELYEKEVLPLRQRTADQAGVGRVLKNMALAFFRLRDHDRCCEFLTRSMEAGNVAEGLQTALALTGKGLLIPAYALERFCALAREAGLTDLERELESLGGRPAPKASFRRTRIFLSYSHEDRAIVLDTDKFLRSSTSLFDVFLDEERLHAGWEWEAILLTHLKEADVFILFIGQDTLERPYVRLELETFLAGKPDKRDRRVIPVILPDCVEIPHEVAAYQGVDLRQEHRGSQLRRLAQLIHDCMYVPASEMVMPEPGHSTHTAERTESPSIQERWDAGEVGIDPRALRQLVNRGIVSHGFTCGHQEYDPSNDGVRYCGVPSVAVCSACGKGACGHAYHVYCRFCTVLPPGDPFTRGNKLFFWCPRCIGPLCTHCLGVEDDYPCEPQEVLSHRFHCPSCRGIVTIVPMLDVDYEAASAQLKEWTSAGGPPG